MIVLLAFVGGLSGGFPGRTEGASAGRDGRLIWVQSEYSSGGGMVQPTVSYFVVQRPAPGERRDQVGEMECGLSVDAGPRGLCPFADPGISPDGKTVAVGTARALTDSSNPPRRSVLALEDADAGRANGTALPDLTEADSDPAWAPDGGRLVFVGRVDGVTDLFVVDVSGANLRRLTFDAVVESDPVWSARGEIAFERKKGLWSIHENGTGLRRLARRGANPDWSPAGSRLIFDRDTRIYTISRTGARLRRLASRGTYPAWSPSGRRIAFRYRYDIYTARTNGTRRKRVYNWPRPRGPSSFARTHAPRDIDWGPRQR